MRKEIFDVLTSHGTLIQPDAAEYLLQQPDPMATLNALLESLSEYPLILTREDISKGVGLATSGAFMGAPKGPEPELEPELDREEKPHRPVPKYDIQIICDITGDSTCEGSIADFSRYFNDRYQRLRRLLKQRREFYSTQSITEIGNYTGDVQLIGMVTDCTTTKNGHKILEIEDEAASAKVLIPANSSMVDDEFLKDEVIGVMGKTSKDKDLIIARELYSRGSSTKRPGIIRPDIPPTRDTNRAKEHVYVAFTSDIHVGSNTFLDKCWGRFVKWLDGNGSRDPIADKIKYLVMPGDVVDGIGVYPSQEEELVISDIYKQYETLAEMIKGIPDHIKIIMSPGNHDAVRPAEPQPTFQKEIQDLFDSNVIFLGNPAYFSLEGVEVLAYHGKSMDDFVTGMRDASYNDPLGIMKEMLKRRHLAPIYGERTPISPESRDHMVIERVPDIFVTGHVHSVGLDRYNRVILVNASTWQAQTKFQKKHNFVPDPAKVPIIDLKSGRSRIMDFSS